MLKEPRVQRNHIGRTHIERINDWSGSDSYVEGSRRDRGEIDMPAEPKYPYTLRTNAFVDGRMIRRGEVVMVAPHQLGAHHQKLPDMDYPPEAEPPLPEKRVPCAMENDTTEALRMELAAMDARVAAMEAMMEKPVEPPKTEKEPKQEKEPPGKAEKE